MGSAGKSENIALKDIQKLYDSREVEGIIWTEISGVMSNEKFSVNGWTLEREAKEYIEQQLEELSKSSSKASYKAFKKAFFLDIKDVFEITETLYFDQELVDKLQEHKRDLIINNVEFQQYNLSPTMYKDEDGVNQIDYEKVIATPDKNNGVFYILEHPPTDKIYKNMYIMATDPIDIDGKEIEANSKFATVVYDRINKTPVAYYISSSRNLDLQFERTYLLSNYYMCCDHQVEKNKGSVIIKLWMDNGLKSRLSKKPRLLNFNKYTSDVCLASTSTSKPIMINLFVSWLMKYYRNIKSPTLIDDLLDFAIGKNADISDAFMFTIVTDDDMNRSLKAHEQLEVIEKPKRKILTTEMRGGSMVRVWKEI
jgi:hypothetical protein